MRLLLIPALIVVCLAGCGPVGPTPMPPRLTDDEQKDVNAGWENALQTPDKLDRRAMLDALIVTHAYTVGVDRLAFRSEKDFSGGTVVMEIRFDRTKPADDRFEVRVRDRAGKELRHLVYSRAEVETTFAELSDPKKASDPNQPALAPEEAAKRQEVQARIEAVKKLFPASDNAPKK